MTKALHRPQKLKAGYTVGRKGFAKISAVEGVRLTPAMEERFRDFDREGLSAEERRKAIARAFRKTR